MRLLMEKIVEKALLEDMPFGDLTSESVWDGEVVLARCFAKEEFVVAGIEFFQLSFLKMGAECTPVAANGEVVDKGKTIAWVRGDADLVLAAERVALNFLQYSSGIATKCWEFKKVVEEQGIDRDIQILDTRKVHPLLRYVAKRAVASVLGKTHRFSLSDAVMIKDNHIKVAGSVKAAVERVYSKVPFTAKIEVEVENFDQLSEALECAKASMVDIIMLDNFDDEMIQEAVLERKKRELIGKVYYEASGGITLERVVNLVKMGVDAFSTSKLITASKWPDVSLEIEEVKA